MPYKDPAVSRAKANERKRAWRAREHNKKYGPGVGNMQGRHGNHARGERSGKWKGGRFITSHGYVAVRVERGHHHAWGPPGYEYYAYEHIIVMEEYLGRALGPDELVHHGRQGKLVNTPTNLTVYTKSDHAKHHSEERGRDRLGRFPPKDLRVREFPEG